MSGISFRPDSDRFWLMVFIGYFAFQAAYRVALGGNLGLDEAQALIEARRLAWGYGAQPPLYDWLQWGVFQALGELLPALSLLKNLLLAITYLAVYALIRSAHPPRVAGLAAASLLLLPQIAWESQRALTHSVLATTLAALSVLIFWTRVLGERRGGYLAFGLLSGLGLLAKANFAFVPVALLLAAASSAEFRPRLRLSGVALGVALAAAIVAVPAAWMLAHPDLALGSAHKFERAAGGAPLAAARAGLAAFARAAAGFLLLLAVVAGILRWRCASGSRAAARPLDRFLLRLILAGLGLVAVAVLIVSATNLKDRWLQPVLFLAAPATTVWLLGRTTEAGARWLARTLALAAALVVVALPVHLLTGTPGSPARGDAPIAALAARLPADQRAGRILADPQWLAANLRYLHPDWRVEDWDTAAPVAGEPVLLIWPGKPDRGAELGDMLAARAGHRLRLGEAARLAAPYPWQPGETFTLYAAPLAP